MHRIAAICDGINEALGRAVRWLALGMVLMMTANVAMRYLFSTGSPWQQEAVRFMHAGLFLLGAGYAFRHDCHVRVDILYQKMSGRGKAWVNLLGVCFLLWPFAAALVWFSWDYVLSAWAIYEGSPEYHGMPGVFLLKTCIWLCSATLAIQGLAVVCRSLMSIRSAHD